MARLPARSTGGGSALVLLAGVQVILSAGATVTSVVGPQLADDMGLSSRGLVWVGAAYFLAFSGLLLLGGRMSDLVGWRRGFRAGVTVFALGSVAGALAPAAWVLILARLVQGSGAALAAPPALALIGAVPTAKRAQERVRAAWGGLTGIGAGLGLLVAGVAGAWASWRWALLLLALAASGAAWTARHLPGGPPRVQVPIDLVGAAMVTSGLVLCSYGLVAAGDEPWGSVGVLGPLGAGLALLAGFVVVERFPAHPLVPPSFLASRRRVVALLAAMLPPAVGASTAFLLPLYFQDVLGWSLLEATAGLLPYTLGLVAGTLACGPLVGRIGAVRATPAGLAVTAAGMALLGRMTADTSDVAVVLIGILVFQIGAGVAAGAAVLIATDDVASGEAALAGSVVNTAMLTGGALGLALLASLSRSRTADLTMLTSEQAAAEGYAWAFTLAAVACVVASVVTAVGLRPRRLLVNRPG